MNATYRHHTVEQLARDDAFRQWVIGHDPVLGAAWTQWLANNPDRADTVTLAQAFLLTLADTPVLFTPHQLDTLTSRAVAGRRAVVKPLWQRQAFRVAASVLILAGIGWAAWLRYVPAAPGNVSATPLSRISPTLATNANELTNSGKTIQSITLSDGSTVALYPNSCLRYPRVFGPDRREVYLNGQAFFSITKNQKQPFWVYTDKISTQVLGTSFMVNAFSQQARASVAVTEGRVSVYRLADIDEARQRGQQAMAGVILMPNQQVSYAGREERFVKSVVENPRMVLPAAPTAFVFAETPVAEVFALLEEAYGLTVVFDEKTMENCYVTANLSGESLTDQLTLIGKVTNSYYELVDGQIIFHGQGCGDN